MTLRSQLLELDGPFHFLRSPGAWLYVVVALGAGLRLFYVGFTEGTIDVDVWAAHARCVYQEGLLACYRGGQHTFNHPPPMGLIAAGLYGLSNESGVPFALVFRLPFALLDGLTALLLLVALSRAEIPRIRNARFVLVALYWINPLAAVLSAYHGNTDISVAFFLLAALLCLNRGRATASGVILGLSLWIKLPGILGLPILFLAWPTWSQRFRFTAAFAVTFGLGYGPFMAQDPGLVIRSVLLYQGLMIQTSSGSPIWGLQVFYPLASALGPALESFITNLRNFYFQWNTLICLIPIVAYASLRENRATTESIMKGLAGSYIILYGFSNLWAFQYLAWSLPFWFMLGPRMASAVYAVSLGYIYCLYAWLTGSPLLLGDWAFVQNPFWPTGLRWLRDAAVLVFFFSALILVLDSVQTSFLRWRNTGRPLSWL